MKTLRPYARNVFITLFSLLTLFAYNNCSKGGFEISGNQSTTSVANAGTSIPLPIVGNESNVMPVKVGCGYVNMPCVSVTICTPGSETCQTIPNILLDTGSYGLRVFSSLVTVTLPSVTTAGGNLGECVSYADGSSNWGPVKTADVVLGREKAAGISIQLIDSAFGTLPTDCTKPDTSPNKAGYNGILGVGLLIQDCGSGCASIPNNRIYFACTGATCNPSTAALTQQVSNPVVSLPVNNNGVALQLPNIPDNGASDITGYLVLGIGTQPNNTPPQAHFLKTDARAMITTDYNGKNYPAFIDSGSNGLFFPGPDSLTKCDTAGEASGFYCPASVTSLSAIQVGQLGSARVAVDFKIMNGDIAFKSTNPNVMFNDIGGGFSGAFDWGLPFFFGRTVYNGIEGKKSPLGVGPYWGY